MKIGVTLCVLNEEIFIGACLRSLLRHPEIEKIAIVESCCKHNEHQCTPDGLSIDGTAQKIREIMQNHPAGHKILFNQFGFSSGKSEVQNIALNIARDGVDYILPIDGDEVWKYKDLRDLIDCAEANPNANAFTVKPIHFWKTSDFVRFGGIWETEPVRLFKNLPGIRWGAHDFPVELPNGLLITSVGQTIVTKIPYYHYACIKPSDQIKAKLKFYSQRNGEEIGDAITPWDESQTDDDPSATEGVKHFYGEHPEEFVAIKWNEKI